MVQLKKSQLSRMNQWIQVYARSYDKAKWNYLFNGGSKDDILLEMLKYQNKDGGFGNGFEPDIILPLSASIPSAEALFQTYEYNLDCKATWFTNLLNYFENSVQSIPKFWEDVPDKIMEYARPPWWNYSVCTKFSPNPCAVISSALLLYGTEKQKELGVVVAKKCFEFLISNDFCDDHSSYNIIKLIETLRSINSPLVTEDIIKHMKRRINENICFDKSKWNGYVPQPLDFADNPSSLWHEDVKQGIKENFQFWIDTINDEGIWIPNFSWGIDSEISSQVTESWKGYIAVKRAKIFMNYGLIDFEN